MDGTGVRGILSIYDDTDSVVGMVQGSTELTTHRKNNGFTGRLSTAVNLQLCLFYCNVLVRKITPVPKERQKIENTPYPKLNKECFYLKYIHFLKTMV